MSLAAYLAKNYLTADTISTPDRPRKKRKKTKHGETNADADGGGLIIADDDPPDLRSMVTKPKKSKRRPAFPGDNDDDDNDEDDDSPHMLSDPKYRTSEFRKSKSKWQNVGGSAVPSNAEQVAADAILASAAAERVADGETANDAPAVDESSIPSAPRMETGARAGLQTASQTAAMVAEKEKQRMEDEASLKRAGKKKKKKGGDADEGEGGETIYRDASGRIINVAMKRAEARRAAEEAAAAEEEAKKALTGDVQRREKEERRAALDEAKFIPIARKVDDIDMNTELRARQRWNDPAAEFLTTNNSEAGVGAAAGGKKVYKGSAQPNRYGIRPGHRWDGVDRANGFERQWFDARNKRERIETLEYAWQMDE